MKEAGGICKRKLCKNRAEPRREETGMVYGYVRISGRDQNEARQMIAMDAFGVDRIYMDKQSGRDFNRPQYQRLMRRLRRGDALVVKSIDRMGRSYEEIIAQWRMITREKGADIVVLDMPLLDTRQGRDLMGTLISDIVLQLLSYVAQTEREMIHERQREGIDAARARGVRFGRRLHISHATFLKWAKESEPAKQN